MHNITCCSGESDEIASRNCLADGIVDTTSGINTSALFSTTMLNHTINQSLTHHHMHSIIPMCWCELIGARERADEQHEAAQLLGACHQPHRRIAVCAKLAHHHCMCVSNNHQRQRQCHHMYCLSRTVVHSMAHDLSHPAARASLVSLHPLACNTVSLVTLALHCGNVVSNFTQHITHEYIPITFNFDAQHAFR